MDTMEDYDMEDVSTSSNVTTIAQQPMWVDPPGPFDFHEGFISARWDDRDDYTAILEQMLNFLERWPPSRTPMNYCAWIAVHRGQPTQLLRTPDVPGLMASFQSLVSSRNVTVSEIDRIAQAHGVLSGKWMIYAKPERVDELWGKVVQMLCLELGKGSMKVSSRQPGQSHVICVYIDDYTNAAEVEAMRKSLKEAGIFWKIGFKPDAYTYLGIYAKNEWNIRASRYFS